MGNQWLTTSDGGHRCQRRTKRRARKAQSKSPPKLKLSRSLRKKRNLQMTDGDHLALLNPRRKGKRVHLKSPRKKKNLQTTGGGHSQPAKKTRRERRQPKQSSKKYQIQYLNLPRNLIQW